jgi:hypothetical protein
MGHLGQPLSAIVRKVKVYQATVTSTGQKEDSYIRLAKSFKNCFRKHIYSIDNPIKSLLA